MDVARNNIFYALQGELEKKLSLLSPGTPLPPETELAAEFGVSRPTLRQSLAELVRLGVVEKRRGVGSFVAESPKTIRRELIFLCSDMIFCATILQSFCAHASECNYFSSVVPLSGDRSAQERILATVIERAPAGVAVFANLHMLDLEGYGMLASSGIPSVYVNQLPSGIAGNVISFSEADAVMRIAVDFYRQGCRRFALFGSSHLHRPGALEREAGFREAMKRCRLKIPAERICPPAAGSEERAAFIELFRRPDRPDAVVCMADACAARFIQELRKAGIPPEGIRISGFDNTYWIKYFAPDIITAEFPGDKIGHAAADLLIRQVENPVFGFQETKFSLNIRPCR